VQSFRKLHVWRRAHAHAVNVRRVTNTFPRFGYSDLKAQIRRSAESVPFNIVEGCGADSNKEFARFLGISIKSTMELEGQLQMARDDGILSYKRWRELTEETIEIRKMLWGLRKKVLAEIDVV
jgi:four helix bundle protein